MKRLLAALLAVSCLFSLLPLALAEPAADDQTQTEAEQPAEDAEQPQTPTVTLPPESAPNEVLAGSTHILSMNISCTLSDSGKATVTQTVQVSFAGSAGEIRFGFPADAKDIKAQGWDGKVSALDGIQYLTLKSDGLIGVQTFILHHTLTGIVSERDGVQQLTLPLLSAQDYRMAALQLSVTLPKAFDSQPAFVSDYLDGQIEDVMTVSVTEDRIITADLREILQDHEAIRMSLTLPEGYFSGNHGESVFGTVITVIVFALLLLTLLYWWRLLRNKPLRVQARTLPPDGVNPGDLPFLLSGGDADFNMLVSYWATLGYVSVYVSSDGNVLLLRRMDMGNERRKYERKLFDLLFGDSDRCEGASIRYKRVGEKAMSVIPRYWSRRLYSKRSGSPLLARLVSWLICGLSMMLAMDTMAPETLHGLMLFVAFVAGSALGWLVHYGCCAYYLSDWIKTGIGIGSALLLLVLGGAGGAALVMLPAVALAVFIGWQTVHGGMRSPYGDQIISQTLGFRRFLHHASRHQAVQMLSRDPQYFYKILPYAQASGYGRRFVGLFHGLQMEPCQWYDVDEGTPRSAGAFYAHYCETLAMLNVSIRQ